MYNRQAAEEMEEDSDKGRLPRAEQQQEDAAAGKEEEPRNACTSGGLKFGSFSWETIPVGVFSSDILDVQITRSL